MESLLKRIERNRREHDRLIALILCLSLIVSMGTFAVFHKTAVAKTYTKEVLECPYATEGAEAVAHVHNDDCYDGETLVCTLPELEAHTHTDECFAEQLKYVCGLEENPGHQHGAECYVPREVNICGLEENPGHEHTGTCFNESGVLICTMEAGEGAHTHTSDCFTTEWDLVCEIPEGEGAHTHTEDCYTIERTLICNKTELPVHVHDAGCIRTIEWTEGEDEPAETGLPVNTAPEMPVSDPYADLETAEDWNREFENLELSGNWARDLVLVAATQQGRGESPNNFEAVLNDAGDAWVRHGYTRYGAWYGYPYAEWDAMFVSFCLRYAGIPAENVPNNPTAALMAESFSKGELFAGRDYIPAVGDLIFFDTIDDEITNIDHMGIVYHVDAENGTINTVEGDRTDAVATFGYTLDDEQIVGYGMLPQNPDYIPVEGETEEKIENEFDGFIFMTTDEEEETEETAATEEEPAPAAPMPAQSWERTAGGIKVTVDAPEGAFPENTTIAVTPVNGNSLKDTVSDAVSGEVLEVQAVDITFFNEEGQEIEPAAPIRVTMTPAETAYAEEKANVVHVDIAQQTAELIEQAEGTETDNTEVVFDAEAFTIYAIVYTYHVDFEYEVDGKVYTSSMPGAKDMPLSEIVKGLSIVDETELETFLSKIASVTSTNEEVAVVTEDRSVRVLKDGDAQIVITMQDGAKFKIGVSADGETEISDENNVATVSTVNDLYLPANSEVKAELLTEEQSGNAVAAVQTAAESDGSGAATYQAFSIALENVDVTAYDGFNVAVALPEDAVVGRDFQLYQVREDGTATDITESLTVTSEQTEDGLQKVSGISFTTEDFADFVLSYSIETYYTTADGDRYRITLNYGPRAEIPEGAELKVKEILPEDETYSEYLDNSAAKLGVNSGDVSFARFFDIEIQKDDEKIEPKAPVQVTISLADTPEETLPEGLKVLHFAQTGLETIEETQAEQKEDATIDLSFEANGFSVYGVVYTVDFHWEVDGKVYEFSLPGGGYLSLRSLVQALGIAGGAPEVAAVGEEDAQAEPLSLNDIEISEATKAFVADVAKAEFSSPELVWVDKVEAETTVGGLKEANGLEVEYSADLTEEQIAEINTQTVEAGDWALISVQSFESEETLTVTMKTGEVFEIVVTDYQLKKTMIDAKGDTWEITVTYDDSAEIPSGASLKAVEILEGSDEYERYYEKTLQVLQEQATEKNYLAGLDFARFFDVTIYDSEGTKIEPKAPVDVRIAYTDPLEVADHADLKVVHFAEEGTEVIDIDNEESAVSEITYEQNGFSVIGTVGTTDAYGWPQGNDNPYVVILQSGDKYYAVAHDGTLKEVHYLNGTVSFMGQGTTTLDYLDDYLWDYTVASSTRHTARLSNAGDGTQYIDPIYGMHNGDDLDAVIGTAKRVLNIRDGKIYANSNYSGQVLSYTLSAEGGTLHRTLVDDDDASPIFFAPKSSFIANSSESEDYDFIDIETLIEEWKRQMTQNLVVDKTAEVYDYENRIYQVDLGASSGYHLITPALALEFVVDASRSMYFPENLYERATYRTLEEMRNWITTNGDSSQTYYVITDPNNKATNYTIYYNTSLQGWYVVDAAYHHAPDGVDNVGTLLSQWSRNEEYDGKIYIADEKVAGQPWCRLDYMKIAVEAAARVLFAVDPSAQIGLVTFNANDFAYGPYTYTGVEQYAAGDMEALITALNNISLAGGTNHAKGLNRAVSEFTNKFHQIGNCQTAVVLITDGAPNGTTWNEIGTAANSVKNMTNYYGQNTRMFTLGLSLENIGTNKDQLAAIATDTNHAFNAERSTEVVSFITKIIEGLVIDANLNGKITDVIDAAFYPVNPSTGMPLASGTWITLEGEVTTSGASNAKGQVINDGGTWKVLWDNQLIEWPTYTDSTNEQIASHGWNGRVYIKAQEDFLGGNDINTNASGSKAEAYEYINPRTNEVVEISDDDAQKEVEFSTPYVNVDELLLDENSTEWTVYLGESVDPKTELQNLINEINVYEVVKDDGTLVYTLTDVGSTANPTEKKDTGTTFKLSTLVGTLTDEDWTSLISGTTKEIVYTMYGHTPGYITISLTQDVKSGEDDLTLSPHNTAVVGEAVEKYTLTVKYEPISASIANYHTGNKLTGSHGADTNDSESENIHIINVFAKGLQITKKDQAFSKKLTGAEFTLYRTARSGETTDLKTINEENCIPVETIDLSDSSSGTFSQLAMLAENEHYYLVETKAPDGYILPTNPIPVTLTVNNSYKTKPNDVVSSTKPESGIYDWTQTAKLELGTSSWVHRTDAAGENDLTHVAYIPTSESETMYYDIANDAGVALPNTGGPGTTLFYLLGIMLTGIAGAGMVMRRRRRVA